MMFFKAQRKAREFLRSSHYGPKNGELRKAHAVVKTTRTTWAPDDQPSKEHGYTIVMR